MQRLIIQYFISFVALVLILAFTHQFLFSSIWPDTPLFYSATKLYVFLFGLFALVTSFVFLINYVVPNFTGFAYIFGVLIKMFATVWFLYPLVGDSIPNKIPAVLVFFAPFFLFLFLQVWYVIRLLKIQNA